MTADLNEVADTLDVFVRKVGVNPIFKKAEIRTAFRNNLINKEQERYLMGLVDAEIRTQDAQSQEIITNFYKQASEILGEDGAAGAGLLSPLSGSADGIMDTNETIAARQLLQPAMDETNQILADQKLSHSEKITKLEKLWSVYNKDLNELVKKSANQRKLKLEGDLALHTRLENINAGNIEINTDDMTFSNKEKSVTITLKNGQTYTPASDGKLYATDNEAFVRAENNIKESNEHYEKSKNYYEQLVKDGKIKEGELVINPYIEDERRLALRYGFRYARKGELLNPANLDRMKDDIELLITEAEQLKDPVIQNNLHWTSFSSPSYTSRGTPIQDLQSLPATFTEDTDKQQMALTNATEFSRVEASQRFKGIGFGITGFSVGRELDLNNEYVSNWTALRTKEHFYKQGSGIDPSLRPGEATPIGGRSVLFGDTPWHIIDIIGHKRGRKADNAILNSDIRQRPLYQRYVFAEQINALEANAPWIPYSHDLNIILEKAGVTPIDFFRQQYFVHTGNTMPAELEESITNRLIQKIDGVANPLYRKGFTKKVINDKDQAMINNREDEKLIANSWMPQQGTLVASTDLKGVLPKKKVEKEITLSTNENNIKRAETNFPIIYKEAKEVGIKFPEIPAAQLGQEAGWGNKPSGKNNYWGLKATSQEIKDGKATLVTTSEVINGKEVIIKDYFKNFDTRKEALEQYKKEWDDPFMGRKGTSSAKTRQEAIKILKEGGYATDPNYEDSIETLAVEYSDLY